MAKKRARRKKPVRTAKKAARRSAAPDANQTAHRMIQQIIAITESTSRGRTTR